MHRFVAHAHTLCRFDMFSCALHAIFKTCMASQVLADCADDLYRWHVWGVPNPASRTCKKAATESNVFTDGKTDANTPHLLRREGPESSRHGGIMLRRLVACGYSVAKLVPIAKLELLKRREQGQDCGAVLDPFCYVDFLSKCLLPSFTAKACPMRFFLCLDFLDQTGRRHYADHTAATAELLQMSPPRLGHITLLFSGGEEVRIKVALPSSTSFYRSPASCHSAYFTVAAVICDIFQPELHRALQVL